MPPKSTDLLFLNALWRTKTLIFVVVLFSFIQKSHSQANSIRTGVTFNWADSQSTLSDSATIQSIDINGVDYNTFVVPSTYEMTRLGPGGHVENNIWSNGTRLIAGSDDPNWTSGALDAYQSLNLNHYFQSSATGDNFCEDYTAIATTDAQIQTIRYNPGIPSNPDGVIAITERGGNNCMYIELYGIPVGGGPEQLLGRTFIRNQGNLTGVRPQAPPTSNSDYWSSGRNNENNQIIGIALYHLSELAPVGSTITSIRYFGATNDHGDGKFFLMQTYAEDDTLEIKLDREGNGDIAANDLVPSGSTYTLISTTSNGTLTFNTDGTFNYIPNPGFTGNDTFQYEVCLPAPNTSVCDTGTAVIVIKLEAIFDHINISQNSTNNRINILDNDNFGSSGPQLNGAITYFTVPTNGTISLNDNGTPVDSFDDFFSYTPNAGFIGVDYFNYEITDAGGSTDIASVYITIAFDTDNEGINNRTDLDDDNDGILDTEENSECIDDDYFAWEFNSPVGTRTNDFVQNPAISDWLISSTDIVSAGAGLTLNSPAAELQLTAMGATTYSDAILQDEYVEVSFTTSDGLINPIMERIGMNWYQAGSAIGNAYDVAVEISKDNFATSILLYSDIRIHYPSNGVSEFFNLIPAGATFNLEENTTYTIRVYTYNQQNDGNVAYSVFDDFTVRVSSCDAVNSDADGIYDHLDLDSDGDGIPDNVEAQTTLGYITPATDSFVDYLSNNGVNSMYLGGLTPVNTDSTDNPDYLDIDSDNEGGNDTNEASIVLSGNDSDNDGLDDATDATTDYSDAGGAIDDPLTVPILLPDIDTDANTGGDVDFRDAITNVSDLDTDDDGILDSFEDLNADGDNDPATDPTNSDNDIYPDYMDIDSDNDGIPDNVEAQTTSSYISPSLQDTNNNGVDDAYEIGGNIGIIPVNTDGLDLPDYLDTDSDNDNVPDNIEGNDQNHDGVPNFIFIGSDKDDDGLDDAFEGVEQIDIDVNDEIDDPINNLPNTDGDIESDYRDLDDDGDGTPTADEDTNGDMDYSNDDWDNDGVPDYLDPDIIPEIEDVEVFNVVTPNGDGAHDFLMITGLDVRPNNTIEIYNRWGTLIYSTASYNSNGNTFDGTSQAGTTYNSGNKLPVGTYYYILNYEDLDGTNKSLSGHMYLN